MILSATETRSTSTASITAGAAVRPSASSDRAERNGEASGGHVELRRRAGADGGLTPTDDTKALSPELVLVDPELAAWARERLQERRVPPKPADPAPAPLVATPRPAGPEISGDEDRPARRSRPIRRRARLLIAAVVGLAVVVAAALVVDSDAPGVSGPAGGRPALALENEPTSPPAPNTKQLPPPPAPPPPAPPPPAPPPPAPRAGKAATIATPHRFAWAPRPRASGYHVELFRGNALVFRATTSKPEIVIPRRWRLNGRTQRLEPGSYRWYVWAQVGGRREGKATVQAKLVLPTR
jgi:hypothetical protein